MFSIPLQSFFYKGNVPNTVVPRGKRFSKTSAVKDLQLSICLKKAKINAGGTDDRAMWSCIHPVHNCLPGISLGKVRTGAKLFGKKLNMPFVVSGMTGGTLKAMKMNKALARACESEGVGFGIGSQRAALEDKHLEATYKVRDTAPNVLLFANIGLAQFLGKDGWTPSRAAEAVEMIGADALCVHINPAQEAIQDEGDTDFENDADAFEKIVKAVKVPVIAKETGCGVSRSRGIALIDTGASAIDVGGRGGTSWTMIARQTQAKGKEETEGPFDEWGIPTPASVAACSDLGVPIIATGGVRSGIHVAKSLILGASCAGMALPVLSALQEGRLDKLFERTRRELATTMFLLGVDNIEDLRECTRYYVTEPLKSWMDAAKK